MVFGHPGPDDEYGIGSSAAMSLFKQVYGERAAQKVKRRNDKMLSGNLLEIVDVEDGNKLFVLKTQVGSFDGTKFFPRYFNLILLDPHFVFPGQSEQSDFIAARCGGVNLPQTGLYMPLL